MGYTNNEKEEIKTKSRQLVNLIKEFADWETMKVVNWADFKELDGYIGGFINGVYKLAHTRGKQGHGR